MAAYDFPDTAGKPTDGSFNYTAPDGTLYEWNGYAWEVPGGSGGSGGGGGDFDIPTQALPPQVAEDGDLWWCTDDGRLYIYYEDVDTTQWVDASPDNGGAGSGDSSDSIWERTGSTINPVNAGDDVEIGSGNITLNADGSFKCEKGTSSVEFPVSGASLQINSTTGSTLSLNGGNGANNVIQSFAGNIWYVTGVDTAPRFIMGADGSFKMGSAAFTGSPNITLDSNGNAIFGDEFADTGWKVKIESGLPSPGGNCLLLTKNANASAGDLCTMQAGINSGDTATRYINFRRSDGTVIGYVGMNGASAVSFSTNSSDYRLKENVVPLPDSIERLKALRPVRYNFIASPDEVFDGFIAHECADIPKAVLGEKDAVDEKGEIQPQGLDVTRMIPLLTDALQKALTRIEALEAEVQSLKGGNS